MLNTKHFTRRTWSKTLRTGAIAHRSLQFPFYQNSGWFKPLFMMLTFLAISLISRADISSYSDQMKSALNQLDAAETTEAYAEVARDFEEISEKYPDEWLPKYYVAACYIFITLVEDDPLEEEAIENYQDKADDILEALEEDRPNESEVYALKALYYVSKITHDPLYKMVFNYWKFKAALEESLAIEPNNPRAVYQQLASDMGKAEQFDNDLTEYCTQADQLLQNWDRYQPQSELHPRWGKRDLAKLLDKCGQP